jgi:hypothetical protein
MVSRLVVSRSGVVARHCGATGARTTACTLCRAVCGTRNKDVRARCSASRRRTSSSNAALAPNLGQFCLELGTRVRRPLQVGVREHRRESRLLDHASPEVGELGRETMNMRTALSSRSFVQSSPSRDTTVSST